MTGAGKYDDLCTQAREAAQAEGAILIVMGGNKGQGFSAQLPLHLIAVVPQMLRHVADEIEADRAHIPPMG